MARLLVVIVFLNSLFLATQAWSATGKFSTLTYNIAGLLEPFSGADSNRKEATKIISCYVNQFDFVNVQEDFNYHATFYDTCNDHPYRSSTSGGMGIGSGLNSLSRFSYQDWVRVRWNDCSGIDCFTPKGFTMARTRLADGVFVDIYNLHAQAETSESALKARRKNFTQILSHIETHSRGHAVIVLGDFNARYTRSGDIMDAFIAQGFEDTWVKLERDGIYPKRGANALVCDPKITSPDCEIVDKVIFRSSNYIELTPLNYEILSDDITPEGVALSDHPPVFVDWQFDAREDLYLSDLWGGPHGQSFNDLSDLPKQARVQKLSLRAGKRVDQILVQYSDGTKLSHGGSGGSERSLELAENEAIVAMKVCSGKKSNRTRIFFLRFETSLGAVLEGGRQTDSCRRIEAPQGWQIVGFHGRSGEELDKIGAVLALQK